ncbi:malonate decarboxylase delta subunit [Sporosarcina newyorkensis 2681]|uniref:Malonate decarboxylase acyl carrier protein n=1 Tax=Sporosarcina newyorkensis 2681 TaxID=1027292 RepID=F9DSI0_9BACL|nr:malonate decarboxylase subunit delta [Sporosarcina newyorkensis]EGQ26317.1 malonate decarboxylase delta subunit [Sporosarcina newyorkensis 2681]
MEKLTYTFAANRPIQCKTHVGVVGSGDLEILLEPTEAQETVVEIRTGITGYSDTWKRVIERFMAQQQILASIKINDFGATPGVVSIRLAQAAEVSMNG